MAVRLYNAQPFPFRVRFEPLARVYPRFGTLSIFEQALGPSNRLGLLGSGMFGMLALRLTEGIVKPVKLLRRMLMTCILRHVMCGRAAATPEGLFKQGQGVYALGMYEDASVLYNAAALCGHAAALAELSWLQLHGRQGVPLEPQSGYDAAVQACRLGCPHGSGVIAYCLVRGIGCRRSRERAVELARASAAAGSRYGQFVMGWMHRYGCGVFVRRHNAQALAYFRLAAQQGLDLAQCSLGDMHADGHCVALDLAEAMRWWQLAGAQRHPNSCYIIGWYYERGFAGVAADRAEAIRWYSLALAGGHTAAANQLMRLGVWRSSCMADE